MKQLRRYGRIVNQVTVGSVDRQSGPRSARQRRSLQDTGEVSYRMLDSKRPPAARGPPVVARGITSHPPRMFAAGGNGIGAREATQAPKVAADVVSSNAYVDETLMKLEAGASNTSTGPMLRPELATKTQEPHKPESKLAMNESVESTPVAASSQLLTETLTAESTPNVPEPQEFVQDEGDNAQRSHSQYLLPRAVQTPALDKTVGTPESITAMLREEPRKNTWSAHRRTYLNNEHRGRQQYESHGEISYPGVGCTPGSYHRLY
jgi:hypothetical protein